MFYTILIATAFFVRNISNAQSVSDAFPDFTNPMEVTRYDVSPHERFPLEIGRVPIRPDIEAWISSLKPSPQGNESLSVSIYRDNGVIQFVRLYYPGDYSQELIYRISQNTIEVVMPRVDGGKGLWANQLGICRWSWHFNEKGDFLETRYLRWNPNLESEKLVFRWILAEKRINQKIRTSRSTDK